MTRLVLLGLVAFALAASGCSCSSSDTNPDGGMPDAGDDGGNGGGGGGPGPHQATTRALLGTSADSVLLDPFVTTDQSLGHFVSVLFFGAQSYDGYQPVRDFVSQSPAGVALPVAAPLSLQAIGGGANELQILAPFPGGSVPFDADVWVSSGDADGKPKPFDPHALVVSIFPNDDPNKVYLLEAQGSPVKLAGRSWVKLALAHATSLPEGGWFSFTVNAIDATVQLQAPEVVPSKKGAGPVPPAAWAPRTDRHRAALAAYAEIVRRKH